MRTLPTGFRLEVRQITEVREQRIEKVASIDLPDESIRYVFHDLPGLVNRIFNEGFGPAQDVMPKEGSANVA